MRNGHELFNLRRVNALYSTQSKTRITTVAEDEIPNNSNGGVDISTQIILPSIDSNFEPLV